MLCRLTDHVHDQAAQQSVQSWTYGRGRRAPRSAVVCRPTTLYNYARLTLRRVRLCQLMSVKLNDKTDISPTHDFRHNAEKTMTATWYCSHPTRSAWNSAMQTDGLLTLMQCRITALTLRWSVTYIQHWNNVLCVLSVCCIGWSGMHGTGTYGTVPVSYRTWKRLRTVPILAI